MLLLSITRLAPGNKKESKHADRGQCWCPSPKKWKAIVGLSGKALRSFKQRSPWVCAWKSESHPKILIWIRLLPRTRWIYPRNSSPVISLADILSKSPPIHNLTLHNLKLFSLRIFYYRKPGWKTQQKTACSGGPWGKHQHTRTECHLQGA